MPGTTTRVMSLEFVYRQNKRYNKHLILIRFVTEYTIVKYTVSNSGPIKSESIFATYISENKQNKRLKYTLNVNRPIKPDNIFAMYFSEKI